MNVFPASPHVPLVLVQKGWDKPQIHPKKSSPTSSPTSSNSKGKSLPSDGPTTSQQFAFVTGTTPWRNRDPEVRKLVRGHVVKDATRKRKQRKELNTLNEKKAEAGSENSSEVESSISSQGDSPRSAKSNTIVTRVLNRPAIGSNLDPHPELSYDIYNMQAMGVAMYPLVSSFGFNPISPAAWFDAALRDEALYHALMYTTSTYAGLISGTTESKESIIYVGKSVSLVHKRLSNMSLNDGLSIESQESTARAVSCLAISEALRGNVDGWRIHMIGLKQMLDLRGGLKMFSISLQLKIHRADLMGATDYLTSPLFSESNGVLSEHPLDYNYLAPSLGFLAQLLISSQLRNALTLLYKLSADLSDILSTPAVLSVPQQLDLVTRTCQLRYPLLPCQADPSLEEVVDRDLEETLRIGALLYIHATPQEFPSSALGPTNLVKRMKELVLSVPIWNEREGVLVIWLLLMACVNARQGQDRIWFVVQLEKLLAKLGLENWNVTKRKLEDLWWVPKLHEKACKDIWDEVLGLRHALKGQ